MVDPSSCSLESAGKKSHDKQRATCRRADQWSVHNLECASAARACCSSYERRAYGASVNGCALRIAKAIYPCQGSSRSPAFHTRSTLWGYTFSCLSLTSLCCCVFSLFFLEMRPQQYATREGGYMCGHEDILGDAVGEQVGDDGKSPHPLWRNQFSLFLVVSKNIVTFPFLFFSSKFFKR